MHHPTHPSPATRTTPARHAQPETGVHVRCGAEEGEVGVARRAASQLRKRRIQVNLFVCSPCLIDLVPLRKPRHRARQHSVVCLGEPRIQAHACTHERGMPLANRAVGCHTNVYTNVCHTNVCFNLPKYSCIQSLLFEIKKRGWRLDVAGVLRYWSGGLNRNSFSYHSVASYIFE